MSSLRGDYPGKGYIDKSLLEPNFGLKVVANSIDPTRMTEIDARTVDAITKLQRTQLSVASNLDEFEVELDRDWVKRLAGNASAETRDLAVRLVGADSLSLSASWPIDDHRGQCERLLELYALTHYREHLEFIDYRRALDDKDADLIHHLEQRTLKKISSKSSDRVTLAPMEIVDEARLFVWKFSGDGHPGCYKDLTLDTLYTYLSSFKRPANQVLDKVRIQPLDDQLKPLHGPGTLRQYLTTEVDLDEKRYVLSLGR